MFDRRTLATGTLALLVAMSHVESGGAQSQAAGAPPAGAPQGRGAGAPQGRGGGGRGGRGSPFTPAVAAKDLKSVLFNWTWHMGMLRGIDEHELVASLEYQGNGTIQVDGHPCTLTTYRVTRQRCRHAGS